VENGKLALRNCPFSFAFGPVVSIQADSSNILPDVLAAKIGGITPSALMLVIQRNI